MTPQVPLPEPQPPEEELEPGTTQCPKCKQIVPESSCCIYCGETLDPQLRKLAGKEAEK